MLSGLAEANLLNQKHRLLAHLAGIELGDEPTDRVKPQNLFANWLETFSSDKWRWDWPHTQAIIDHLQKQAEGEIENLMVLCPPQHGKSELVTIRYPVWRLHSNQSLRIIIAAYNQEYVEKIARKARSLAIDCIRLNRDRRAVAEWETIHGGSYKAVGIGSGVTGNPAELAIIDDPIKSREEAESLVYRDRNWNWYTDELGTRIQKNGRKCLVLTPWHEDDLRGRILNSAEASRWTVLRLPAIAEPDDPLDREEGEPLCPDLHPLEELEQHRAVMGAYSFEAMYQCNPVLREGNLFQTGKIEMIDTAPAGLKQVRAYDLAATAGGGDYTAAVLMGRDPLGYFYILNVERGQVSPDVRNKLLMNLATQDGKQTVIHLAQDPGQAGKEQAQQLARMLAGWRVETERVSGDKVTRADPFAAQVNAGNVRMVRGNWNRAYIEELRSFPSGVHDDQVDASADAFNALMHFGTVSVNRKGRKF